MNHYFLNVIITHKSFTIKKQTNRFFRSTLYGVSVFKISEIAIKKKKFIIFFIILNHDVY
jgi:hypothetical protein